MTQIWRFTGFTGTAAVIGCLVVFFLVLKWGGYILHLGEGGQATSRLERHYCLFVPPLFPPSSPQTLTPQLMKNNLQSWSTSTLKTLQGVLLAWKGFIPSKIYHKECLIWSDPRFMIIIKGKSQKKRHCPNVFPYHLELVRSDWFLVDDHKNRNWGQVWRIPHPYNDNHHAQTVNADEDIWKKQSYPSILANFKFDEKKTFDQWYGLISKSDFGSPLSWKWVECTESFNAMTMHFNLKLSGVPNYHFYYSIGNGLAESGGQFYGIPIISSFFFSFMTMVCSKLQSGFQFHGFPMTHLSEPKFVNRVKLHDNGLNSSISLICQF